MSRERRLQTLRLESSIIELILPADEDQIAISGLYKTTSQSCTEEPGEWVVPPSAEEDISGLAVEYAGYPVQ